MKKKRKRNANQNKNKTQCGSIAFISFSIEYFDLQTTQTTGSHYNDQNETKQTEITTKKFQIFFFLLNFTSHLSIAVLCIFICEKKSKNRFRNVYILVIKRERTYLFLISSLSRISIISALMLRCEQPEQQKQNQKKNEVKLCGLCKTHL